jgi:hypothetical protein
VKEGISEIEGKLEKLLCSDDNKEKNKLSWSKYSRPLGHY